MSIHHCSSSLACRLFSLTLLLVIPTLLYAAETNPPPRSASPLWSLQRKTTAFDRIFAANPKAIASIKATGMLRPPDFKFAFAGWLEYDVEVPADGWYEWLVLPNADNHEYAIDGGTPVFPHSNSEKVASFFLTRGKHSLRIQRFHWTGFANLTEWVLQQAPPHLATQLAVTLAGDRDVFRKGEKVSLRLQAGNTAPAALEAWLTDLSNQQRQPLGRIDLPAPTAPSFPTTVNFSFPCKKEGFFLLHLGMQGKELPVRDFTPIRINSIDTTPPLTPPGDLHKTLLAEVDCTAKAPDYFGGGESRVVKKSFGSYRESGDVGWRDHMNSTEPSWFAYSFATPQGPGLYAVEVDYPDDALRTFAIAVRDPLAHSYPTAGGVDSGGEFSLSNSLLTHTILHWHNGDTLRVVLITPRTGRRAAAARIRLYRVHQPLPPFSATNPSPRHFGTWYEEGGSYLGMYGVPPLNDSLREAALGADRWASCVRYIGGDTLWYTHVVYQFSMYPSRYNTSYTALNTPDTIRVMLLEAEKYHLNFIAEFHPEARDLAYPTSSAGDDRDRNLLINKDGKVDRNDPGHYNPLLPEVQDWTLGLLTEFVSRYKDSPAFTGISIRLMNWFNHSLTNFHSLDWGYDDYTISLFEKDTGLKIPAPATGPDRFRMRYDWLILNQRAAWIDWRCQKITELHQRIAQQLRAIRPDLTIYLDVFSEFPDDLREIGIDAAALEKIPGLSLVNALAGYGRRGPNLADDELGRKRLLDPAIFRSLAPHDFASFLFGGNYFEATEVVVPGKSLGFPATAKDAWMSAVVNPAGRHYLERWALAMAESDAHFLADGGNTYLLGQPLLREFLTQYRALPDQPFTPRPDARDPVAVWEHADPAGLTFYAVNRERFPITTTIHLPQGCQVSQLASATPVATDNDTLRVTLEPYQLLAYFAPNCPGLVSVTVEIPPAEWERTLTQQRWFDRFVADARAGKLEGQPLSAYQKRLLHDFHVQYTAAVKARHIRRARNILEDITLTELFIQANRQPPALRFLGVTPVKPPTAWNARQLQSLTQSDPPAQLVPAQDIVPGWLDEQLLVSSAPLTLQCTTPVDARYHLTLGYVVGHPRFGDFSILSTDQLSQNISTAAASPAGETLTLEKSLPLAKGATHLVFQPADHSSLALAFAQLTPVALPVPARHWLALGPFPGQPADIPTSLGTPYSPESAAEIPSSVTLPSGTKTTWKSLTGDTAFINLEPAVSSSPAQVDYAWTTLNASQSCRVRLVYGLDYWAKLFLNHKLIADHTIRPPGPPVMDQFSLDVDLQPGRNDLLVKLASGSHSNGFWMFLAAPDSVTTQTPQITK